MRKTDIEITTAITAREQLFDYLNRLQLPKPASEVNAIKAPRVITDKTQISLLDTDTISATIQAKRLYPNARIAILNFASYKHPGGGFMANRFAQEEAICYCTNLYPELAKYQEWYDKHLSNLNRGLYANESILTHNISIVASQRGVLLNPADIFTIDVLTCAAPNWTLATKYKTISLDVAAMATKQRVDYVMNMLSQDGYDIIILGAYGCGVFRNDPVIVAQSFAVGIAKYYGCFRQAIFAIPDATGTNYQAFKNVLGI